MPQNKGENVPIMVFQSKPPLEQDTLVPTPQTSYSHIDTGSTSALGQSNNNAYHAISDSFAGSPEATVPLLYKIRIEGGWVEAFLHSDGYAWFVGIRYSNLFNAVIREDKFVKRVVSIQILPLVKSQLKYFDQG